MAGAYTRFKSRKIATNLQHPLLHHTKRQQAINAKLLYQKNKTIIKKHYICTRMKTLKHLTIWKKLSMNGQSD